MSTIDELIHPRREDWSPPTKKRLGETVIEVDGLSKSYKLAGRSEPVPALLNVNLKSRSIVSQTPYLYPIKAGEFVMIRGPSGGGKTTLLNLIGTLDAPSSGEIRVCGHSISSKTPDSLLSKLRMDTIGFVFQTFNLLATQSAFENVCLPMVLLGKLSKKDREARAKALLSRVGLGDRLSHLPSELSGGEQQRTAIARALANEPRVLLMDEPTGDLDTRATVEVMDLLLKINQRGFSGKDEIGTTIVMVTHNPDIECYADRVLYVRDGVIERQAINPRQRRLKLHTYVKYLNSIEEMREKVTLKGDLDRPMDMRHVSSSSANPVLEPNPLPFVVSLSPQTSLFDSQTATHVVDDAVEEVEQLRRKLQAKNPFQRNSQGALE